jgi:hypothetical protein
MKKREAESHFDALCDKWETERGFTQDQLANAHFTDFWDWLRNGTHVAYSTFESTAGARYDMEAWFDARARRRRLAIHDRRSI